MHACASSAHRRVSCCSATHPARPKWVADAPVDKDGIEGATMRVRRVCGSHR